MHLGLKDTNVEGDLVVEHFNLIFKVSDILICLFCRNEM